MWKAIIKGTLSLGLLVPIFLVIGLSLLFGFIFQSEGYCMINPDIDTHYSRGYTHKGFATITAGMDTATVIIIIGQPLYRDSVYWNYSSDGKADPFDFAWLQRYLVIQNGKVMRKVAFIAYD